MARSMSKYPSRIAAHKTLPQVMSVGTALTHHAVGQLNKHDCDIGYSKPPKRISSSSKTTSTNLSSRQPSHSMSAYVSNTVSDRGSSPLRSSSFGTSSSTVSAGSAVTPPPPPSVVLPVFFSIDNNNLRGQQHQQQQDQEQQHLDMSMGSSSSNSTVSSTGGLRRNATRRTRAYRRAERSDLLPTMAKTSTPTERSFTPPRRRRTRTASYASSSGSDESPNSSRGSGPDVGPADTTSMLSFSTKAKSIFYPWMQKNSPSPTLPLFDSGSEHNKGHPSGQLLDKPNITAVANTTATAKITATTKKYISRDRNTLFLLRLLSFAMFAWVICDMYLEATGAALHIENITSEEAVLMMKLQRVEQQALQLHESMVRLLDDASSTSNNEQQHDGGRRLAVADGDVSSTTKSTELDTELIRVQKEQLKMMDEEVGLELVALQEQLQKSSRTSIIENYGDNPIQLDIALDFGATTVKDDGVLNGISIELWPDTPYAAWALLRQVEEGVWTGSKFRFGKGFSLKATPKQTPQDIEMQTRLEFVEQLSTKSITTNNNGHHATPTTSSETRKPHDAMTVGLMKGDHGGLALIINLQDNFSQFLNHDITCIGKVIDGYDAMQTLVTATRKGKKSDDLISIKSITVNKSSEDRHSDSSSDLIEASL